MEIEIVRESSGLLEACRKLFISLCRLIACSGRWIVNKCGETAMWENLYIWASNRAPGVPPLSTLFAYTLDKGLLQNPLDTLRPLVMEPVSDSHELLLPLSLWMSLSSNDFMDYRPMLRP